MHGVFLTDKGAVPAFRIDRTSGGLPMRVHALWDGTRYAVVWHEGDAVFVQRVTEVGGLDGALQRMPVQGWISTSAVTCTTRCELVYEITGTDKWWRLPINGVGTLPAPTEAGTDDDILWKQALPTFAHNPWFGSRGGTPTKPAPAGVETPAGSLVAWAQHTAIAYAFTPADPTHARHEPIAIEGEQEVQATALDTTKFALVTVQKTPGHQRLVARIVDVNPAYFASHRGRAPAATGVVLGSDGAPSANAMVAYAIETSNVKASADGTFTIPHPEPNNTNAAQDIRGVEAWAHGNGDTSTSQRVTGGAKLTIRMTGPASLSGTIDNAVGDIELRVDVLYPDATPNHRPTVWTKRLTVRDRFDVGALPAGRTEIRARSKDGRRAFVALTTSSGKRSTTELELDRPGALTLDVVGAEANVMADSMDTDDVIRTKRTGRTTELVDLPAGVRTLTIRSGGYTMTRRIMVRPGVRARVAVAFEADLPPGRVGINLADTARGVEITALVPGSAADKVGLRVGDVVALIDGVKPASTAAASARLFGKPGTWVSIVAGRRSVKLPRSDGSGIYAARGPAEIPAR
jgi:hypothetical protein